MLTIAICLTVGPLLSVDWRDYLPVLAVLSVIVFYGAFCINAYWVVYVFTY